MTYILTAGDFGWRSSDAYAHSIVFDATLSENLNYVLQSDFLRGRDTGEENVGINQYLIHTVNDCLAVGGRVEWWKIDTVSHYEATLGANIKPHANLTFRPEVRFDWSPSVNYEETIFGVDAIMTF